MVYPFLIENGKELRAELIANGVFVASYWPNVEEWVKEEDLEFKLQHNLVPLPVDQRLDKTDVERVINHVLRFING